MRVGSSKPVIGERVLYFLVWGAVILVPILNSKMMSEEHIYLVNLMTAWSKILPYVFIFFIHNELLVPKLLLKNRFIRNKIARKEVALFLTRRVTTNDLHTQRVFCELPNAFAHVANAHDAEGCALPRTLLAFANDE